MRAVALKPPSKNDRLAELPGARPARYPGFIAPCDPTLRERAPQGPDWLHEIKIDGYRAQLHIHDRPVLVFSRSGYDRTQQFAQIARAAEALSTRDGSRTLIVAEFARLRAPVYVPSHGARLLRHYQSLVDNGNTEANSIRPRPASSSGRARSEKRK